MFVADRDWLQKEAQRSYLRLTPSLAGELGAGAEADVFLKRLNANFPGIFAALLSLYGDRYDFFWHLEQIVIATARSWAVRPAPLRAHDAEHQEAGRWFLDNRQLGAVCYVDRFAGDLAGLRARLPYLRELGVTYLHLMPLFCAPAGDNDGGYAVSDYRNVASSLGTMAELSALAQEFRNHSIRLVLDFVLNHTADDHPWAERAKAGDPDYQTFYFMYDDRKEPERYLPMLREIFPDRGGDSFVWREDVAGPHGGKHVWSTFYPFQWDLNYRNPAVFRAILEEMLFLANQGIEVLRLDAVPFLWKSIGTTCENQPEAHLVVQALKALSDVAAPALIFKSEAIVHPDEVTRYVDPSKCHLSYNPLFMVLLWEALATRDTRHMHYCLERRFKTAEGTAWVNYIRSHDDIGWGFADQDAWALAIEPHAHRRFLNDFYAGNFSGSFARGLRFQENPRTGDCRIAGTLASLAGLDKALGDGDASAVDLAVRRILLVHGLILTLGGMPLIYLGDEIAQLNDDAFDQEPAHADDRRWVHRPRFDDARLERARRHPESPEGRVFTGIKRLIALRFAEPALAGNNMRPFRLDERYLIAFHRTGRSNRVTVVGNFSEHRVEVCADLVRSETGARLVHDLWGDERLDFDQGLQAEPYQFMMIRSEGGETRK